MDFEKVKEILDRIPFVGMLMVYLLWVGYQTYGFLEDPASPLQMKKTDVVKQEEKNKQLDQKVKAAKEFYKNLDVKRLTLRNLTGQLNETRATLSEENDIPGFIKLVVTEAKKVGLTVSSIQPTTETVKELWVEQKFEMQYRGVFVQLLVFLQRLANLQKIIRSDEIDLKPVGQSNGRFVEIEGRMILQTFRYSASKTDAQKTGGAK